MASGFRAHRARYVVLFCLVVVLAATLASYFARQRLRRPEGPRPAPIAEDVSQRTQAFSLSKTLGEHTLYTIHAEQVTNYESNGKAALRNVSVLIYGKDGSRHDTISAAECLYDSNAASIWVPGDVEMKFDVQLQPSGASGSPPPDQAAPSNPVTIRTSKLTFEQNTGAAWTDAPVAFQFAQGDGSSDGAKYDPQKEAITLNKNVVFHLTAAGKPGAPPETSDPTEIRAAALHFNRGQGQILLENSVEVVKGTRRVRGTHGELMLNASYAIEKATIEGDIVATDQAENFSAELKAQRADIAFAAGGRVATLHARGDGSGDANDAVRWTTNSPASGQSRQGQAQQVDMFFKGETSALERAVARGNVRMTFHRAAGGKPSDGRQASQNISGDAVETKMSPDGKTVTNAMVNSSANSPATLVLEPQDPSADRRTVTADHFDLSFYPSGGLSDFHAEKGVAVISDATAGPVRHRESGSDSLEATFDQASGQVNHIRQWGNFNYRDPERQAKAQNADYLTTKNSIMLTGDPVVWDPDGKLTAKRIEIQSAGGGLTAEENVGSTFVQKPSAASNSDTVGSTSTNSTQPVHAVADRMQYDGGTKTSHFQGHARLWEGDGFLLEGDAIQWNPQSGELLAQKQVYSIFRQASSSPVAQSSSPVQKGAEVKGAEVKPVAAKQNASSPDNTMTIRADSLAYNHAKRLAHYEGSVRMQNASGTVSAASLDVLLKQPASPTAQDLSLDSGQIERATAKDHVRIVDGGRDAVGDTADYLPAESQVHLSGKLAKVTDPRRGTVEAPELTYFLGDDRIQVQGSPGSPTETRWKVRP